MYSEANLYYPFLEIAEGTFVCAVESSELFCAIKHRQVEKLKSIIDLFLIKHFKRENDENHRIFI